MLYICPLFCIFCIIVMLGLLYKSIQALFECCDTNPYIISMDLYIDLKDTPNCLLLPISEKQIYYLPLIRTSKKSFDIYQSMYPILYKRFYIVTAIYLNNKEIERPIAISTDEAGVKISPNHSKEYRKLVMTLNKYYYPKEVKSILLYTHYQK